jgi:NADPH:quinone reductase-like Zn-dependent oxidoreductase
MKALQIMKYGEIKESLSMRSKTLLKPKDILVEVKAASLNPIDYKLVEGKLKDMISLDLPITIGFDVSGVVIEKCYRCN